VILSILIRLILGVRLQGSEVLGSGFRVPKAQGPSISKGVHHRLAAGFSPLSTNITSNLLLLLFNL
jgi:hypothetical protein